MKEFVLCDDSKPEEVVPLCKKYGLGIEIQSFHNPNKVDECELIIEKYKQLLPENISCHLHAPYADLCFGSNTPLIVDATRFYFNYAYSVAKKLDVKSIVIHHGYVPKTSYMPNWIKRSVTFWNDFLSDKSDVSFNLENQLEWNCEPLVEIIDKVNSEKLGVNLDIGHAHANSKEPVINWIKSLGNRIKYVHLHNNHGEYDEHLGLTHGTIDIIEILNALNHYAPDAIWALECQIEHMEESIEFLKENKFI